MANSILGNLAVIKLEAENLHKDVTIFDILKEDDENTGRMTPDYFKCKRPVVFGSRHELVRQLVVNYSNMINNKEEIKKAWNKK